MIEPVQVIDTPVGPVRLRPETEADADFRYQLFCRSRLPEWDMVVLEPGVREQIMRHQFMAQTQSYLAQFPRGRFDIIEHEGAAIGRIVVDRPDEQLHLVDVAIVPAQRRRGIGGAILRDLMDEAAASGVPMRLSVASDNDPSKALYERLGFVVVARTPMYLDMAWMPQKV